SETIFMNPCSLEFLFNRLNKRPQTFEELKFRFNKGLEELTLYYSGLYKLFKHEYKVESDDNSKIINHIRDLYPFVRGPEGNIRHHKER
ncbi:MAG: hypothetical protein QG639_202, partial [Patescibacteria group bacterium]|nr:hypothetical protein [Patescibacteria group bacterium]